MSNSSTDPASVAGGPLVTPGTGPRGSPGSSTLAETFDAMPAGSSAQVPTRIGRYTILRRLGEGGMGTVWSAYDDSLDRRVAIKVVSSASQSPRAHERMVREAKSLARINHPNVVQVFEVGALGDDLFVAMEYVVGESLRQWLAATPPRSFAAVLDAFVQAGRGLAAVHEAKLVHRDVKPDNIMVGSDGRVRLVDFGIARLEDGASSADEAPVSVAADVPLDRVTKTGEFVGTPMFMSPEQLRGLPVDARSDQFAFCVSLFRAVYGLPPFPGDKLGALAQNVFLGNIIEPPRTPGVPAALAAMLRRGLAVDPGARWPSMDALLAALGTLVRRPGRERVVLGSVAAVAVAAVGVAFAGQRDDDACAGGPAALAPTWDPARASTLVQGFTEHGAAAVGERVRASLDGHAEQWLAQHRDSCRAHQRGEQSDALLDRAMACLDARRRELAALVHELEAVDAELVRAAPDAVLALGDPRQCGDVAWLERGDEESPTPEQAPEVDRLRTELVQAEAQEWAGRGVRARETIAGIRGAIDALDYAPLRMELYRASGLLSREEGRFVEAQAELQTALTIAIERRLERDVAELVIALAMTVGVQQGRFAEVDPWLKLADAWLLREGDPPLLRVELLQLQAGLEERGAKYEQAEAHLREGLARLESMPTGRALRNRAALNNELGLVLHRLRRWDESIAAFELARAQWLDLLGPEHPVTTDPLNNLGSVYIDMHRPDDAVRVFQEVLAQREAIFGHEHPKVAHILHNLGSAMDMRDDRRAAIDYFAESLAILERQLGPDDPALALPLMALGEDHTALGEPERALPYLERALAIDLAQLGPDHPEVAWDLHAVANAYMALGRWSEARQAAQRSLAIREHHGVQPDRIGQSRFALAKALAGEGDLTAARAQAQLAVGEYAAEPQNQVLIEEWLAQRAP
ncbi:MAG: serine/threonine-protein kinase [Nannocystaceae bacterium]|nr:serine/threonine-protein kinase [Nannocystaceae bacterium]